MGSNDATTRVRERKPRPAMDWRANSIGAGKGWMQSQRVDHIGRGGKCYAVPTALPGAAPRVGWAVSVMSRLSRGVRAPTEAFTEAVESAEGLGDRTNRVDRHARCSRLCAPVPCRIRARRATAFLFASQFLAAAHCGLTLVSQAAQVWAHILDAHGHSQVWALLPRRQREAKAG